MIDEIERRLAEGLETGRFEGLLFHGSGEPWSGDPQVGGDGIFWTTTSAVIAQQYIPASGSASIVGKPRLSEVGHIWPENHSFWHDVARQMSGLACSDVQFDDRGQLSSWRYPEGWPTYEQCLAWLENEMGYAWEGEYDVVSIKMSSADGDGVVMPASWFREGTLLVTLADGLSLRDLRDGPEGDLMNLEYHNYEGFEAATRDGMDAVIINDFAQSDDGNIGHVSYGLTQNALAKLEWLTIPARRHVYSWNQTDDLTGDLRDWAAHRSQDVAHGLVSPRMAM